MENDSDNKGAHALVEQQSSLDEPHRSKELTDLRQQIEGKNELISALVAELEQVAEQLERSRRTGSDRPRAPSSGSLMPAELVQEHQNMLGELQNVVHQWEELQAAATLERIESQLSELRSLVTNGVERSTAESRSEDLIPKSPHLDSIISRLTIDSIAEKEPETRPASNWEAIKRELQDAPSSVESNDDHLDETEGLLTGLPNPDPVDFSLATSEDLKRAIIERDAYIVQITRWVRTRRAVSPPTNWDQLQSVPEEMRRQVNYLTARLEEQVRLAEVEMSLERARLAREKSHFQSDLALIERHMKRLGIASLDELEGISVNNSSSTDRRWMRFLGVNRTS